ncbi:MAG TPA: hypothetical protein VGO52_26655 [Hyphomonadaceae bacterium]|jgi:hypothetical protein|nr:hypothetical protein [Hyphomonadaceae bacterium]
MPTPHTDHRPSSKEVAREIDRATPSQETKRAVAEDLDAHLPDRAAEEIPGQASEEPLKKSQREVQDDEGPGS